MCVGQTLRFTPQSLIRNFHPFSLKRLSEKFKSRRDDFSLWAILAYQIVRKVVFAMAGIDRNYLKTTSEKSLLLCPQTIFQRHV
jgi:hypothetical protein